MVEMCWSRHGKSPDSVASLIPSHPRFRRTPFAVFTTTTTTTTVTSLSVSLTLSFSLF
ncbi:hypothetical protein HA466_0160400 [Hirschfeldia incana]|nr:hypothetical protein HA466_0160400 [Hirschfeldia incana]